MFSLLTTISIGYFKHNKLRSILTIFGIILGVSIMVAMRLVSATIFESITHSIDVMAGKAVLQVSNGKATFPEELLDKVREISAVDIAAPLIMASAMVKGLQGEYLQIFGVDLLSDQQVRDYEFSEDTLEMEDPLIFIAKPDSIVITSSFSKKYNFQLDSNLTLVTNLGIKNLKVRGILKDSGPAKGLGGNFAIMDVYAAQQIFSKEGRFDQIDIIIKPGFEIEKVQKDIEKVVCEYAQVQRPISRGKQIENLLGSLKLSLRSSGVIAMFVGLFLIYNTVSISVVQRKREIGILRSLGVTRRQIYWLFLSEALTMGIVGSVLGIFAGYLLALNLLPMMEKTMNAMIWPVSLQKLSLSPIIIAIGFLGGLFTTLFAALFPSQEAARISPLVAMRRDIKVRVDVKIYWKVFLIGLASFLCACFMIYLQYLLDYPWIGISSTPLVLLGSSLMIPYFVIVITRHSRRILENFMTVEGKLAGDNLTNAPGRTAVTLAALMIGISAVVNISIIHQSLENSIKSWMDQVVHADIAILSSSIMPGPQSNKIPDTLIDELKNLSGVDIVWSFSFIDILYEDKMTFLISTDVEERFKMAKVKLVKGDLEEVKKSLLEGSGVLATVSFCRQFKKGIGDEIRLKTPTGWRSFKIVGNYVDYTADTGAILIDRKSYREYWKDNLVSGIHLVAKKGANIQSLIDQIKKQFGEKYNLFVLSDRDFKTEIISNIVKSFRITRAMEIIVILIAGLGVINTLLAAIIDRTREIGILRALGATRWQIKKSVLLEAVMIGIIGSILGILLGTASAFPIIKITVTQMVGWYLSYHISFSSLIIALITSIIVCMLAGYYPASKASKLNIVQAIEFE